jgi:hypothetical protein
VQTVRARLKNPPVTAPEYLATLRRHELVTTAAELEEFAGVI